MIVSIEWTTEVCKMALDWTPVCITQTNTDKDHQIFAYSHSMEEALNWIKSRFFRTEIEEYENKTIIYTKWRPMSELEIFIESQFLNFEPTHSREKFILRTLNTIGEQF
jgi:hypothetical protein